MTTYTIKPMYLFFDSLYASLEIIGQDNITEWAHKETPKLRYCIMDAEDAKQDEMDTDFVQMFDTMEEAQEELDYC